MSSYQFESSSPPSLSSSISSLSSISSSESSPQSSFISSYFNKEGSDAIISQRQQQLQLQLQQQQQRHQNHRSQQCHHLHCQQHHSSRNAQNNNNNPLMVVGDQTRAKTKNEDYDYSILNIIPNLISEKKKKTMFVEKLVEMTCHIIGIIWADDPNSKDIPLKTFVQETLRRSRTSYSTLQATLFYLFRIREKISHQNNSITDRHNHNNGNNGNSNKPAACCRRMFLAALIVASKYLQDCNYSNRAWSRVTGLPIKELNSNEICFLRLIDYNLFISENNFKHWSSMLLKYVQETLYIPGTESRKNPIDNNNNNNYHHPHHPHRPHHHPHNHPFINDILENQYSIIRLREIMKSMDEFEGLTQRPGCQNNNNNNNSPINYHQNCKYVRTMAN